MSRIKVLGENTAFVSPIFVLQLPNYKIMLRIINAYLILSMLLKITNTISPDINKYL